MTAATDGPEHGGDLAGAERRFGRPAAGWLDLSTGINPHPYPYPFASLPAEAWHRLPDSGAMDRLRAAAAAAYGVSDPDRVVPAPGTQALIQWLPQLVGRTRVQVLGPTYAEHAVSWNRAGHTVAEAEALADLAAPRTGVAVVVNPNNPDGRRLEPAELVDLAGEMARRRGLLVVDEAFADVDPALSLAGRAGTPGLVVLRSFGKFFGLAGLRLGFALAEPDLAQALTRALGPWCVSGPAVEVGAAALADAAWVALTRQHLADAAARLRRILTDHGLEVVGGTDLFVLARHDGAEGLHRALAGRGILVRPFPTHPDRLRFGLPPDDGGWDRLDAVLTDWRRGR